MNKPIPQSELMHSIGSEPLSNRKVCIVTGELEGPYFNGGVGTTNRALAIVLRELGYDVDILYTQVEKGAPLSIRGQFADHVATYAKWGIRLLYIDNQSDRHDWQAKSFLSLQHLLKQPYRLVFFDDLFGTAYYPLLARRTGNERLQDTVMCVTTHGAMEWITDLNRNSIMNFESLPLMEMERRSVELADVVKSPSAYILEKYRKYGWAIARDFIVLPNFVSGKLATVQKSAWKPTNEIVFFGRLERRKGLRLFCRALDRIKFDLKTYTVTFLGKAGPDVTDKLIRKAATWPFNVRLLGNFDQAQAISYLKTGDRLAVMPSTEDNSPSAILECLEESIPFICSSGSGGEELLDEESRYHNLFEPSVDALADKLLDIVAGGGGRTGRPSFSPDEIKRAFAAWMDNALAPAGRPARPAAKATLSRKPHLIVIVPPEAAINQAAADLKRAADAFHDHIHIEALTSSPKLFEKGLAALGQELPIHVSDIRDFSKIAQSLSAQDPSVLGICHLSQILTPEWFERARQCFETTEHIRALTGMAGETRENNEPESRQFVSRLTKRHTIRQYLVGNASPLFALMQSTNSGFLLMRSDLAGLLADTTIMDEQYERLNPMEELIHSMLIKLNQAGHTFELVPDLLQTPVRELPVEGLQSGNSTRALATNFYGHARGTDQWLVSRLAIDSGLKRKRLLESDDYRTYLAAKTGVDIAPVNSETTWDQQSRELAMIAQACGQIPLSIELTSRLAFPQIKAQTLSADERLHHAANTVRLANLLSSPACVRINLAHEWSLKVVEDGRDIQLHANRADEGRAVLLFTSIDLSSVRHFTCQLTIPANANPVRVRADLVSLDRTQSYSSDQILVAHQDVSWDFAVPEKLRAACKVSLSVEMADPADEIHDAFVHITDPRFVSEVSELTR